MAGRRKGATGRPADLPAGDERREAEAQVADELAEQIDAMPEGAKIDPRAFKVENELAQHFNILDVSNGDLMLKYRWVYSGQHGLQIKMALADGWQVVQGDDPEAIELKGIGADTTRRLGDVILMKIPRDKYVMIQRREARKREAQEQAVSSRFEEIIAPYRRRGYGATAIVNGVDVMTGAPIDSKRLDFMHNRAMARAAGDKMLDAAIRDGSMPGVPVTGSEVHV